MKYNLFLNYYIDPNPERQKEIDFCFEQNFNNDKINCFCIIVAEENKKALNRIIGNSNRVILTHLRITDKRPTYNDFFDVAKTYFGEADNINIICNSDIIACPQTMIHLPHYFTSDNKVLALSRWDVSYMENYQINSSLFNRSDSQDTWIFKGGINQINGADFTMGVAGCDNSIAHLLENAGYEVINPSMTIRTYHVHLSNIRNYINGDNVQRVPPPYKLVTPTT
jgi:hypothetical protein